MHKSQAKTTRCGPPGSTIVICKETIRFNNSNNSNSNDDDNTTNELDTKVAKSRPLKFIAHGLGVSSKKFDKLNEIYEQFNKWKIPTNKLIETAGTLEEMMDYYDKISQQRSNIEYDIDGIVFKINNILLQNRLGFVGKNPRWAVALKFSAEKTTTLIKRVRVAAFETIPVSERCNGRDWAFTLARIKQSQRKETISFLSVKIFL